MAFTHSVESEIPEHTTGSARGHTAVLDLCWAGVAVHLGQLELGLGASTLRKAGVADDVAERLAVHWQKSGLNSNFNGKDSSAWAAIAVPAGVRRTYRSGSICANALRLL